MTTPCTCLEVFGEDPDCPEHGVRAVIRKLRLLAAGEYDDVLVADDAADLLEWFADERDSHLGGKDATHG